MNSAGSSSSSDKQAALWAPTCWLLAALVAGTLPFVTSIPPWMLAMIPLIAWWRLRQARRGMSSASTWWRIGISIGFIALLAAGGNLNFGLDAATPLFIGFLWIKVLELKNDRDVLLAALLNFMLVAVLLFARQSIADSVYAFLVVCLTTAALVRYHTIGTSRSPLRITARLFMQALPIMAVLFLFFPRLQTNFPNVSGQGISGFSDSIRPGDVARMALSDQVVFRVEFVDGHIPDTGKLYWRGVVLSECSDGMRWTYRQQFHATRLPIRAAQADQVAHDPVAQDITMMANNQRWLFALDNPISAPDHCQLLPEQSLRRDSDVTFSLRYQMTSDLALLASDRDSAIEPINNHHLKKIHADVHTLAHTLQSRGHSVQEWIDATQAYFHEQGFTYSLEPGSMESDTAYVFLFQRRSGFCAHYATAFATLMRMMNVPARVVVGYRGGEVNPYGGFLIVRQLHAHAWCEVWNNGHWQRVDPTVGIPPAPGQATAAAVQAAAEGSGAFDHSPVWLPAWLKGSYQSTSQWWQYVEARWDSWIGNYDIQRQFDLLSWLTRGRTWLLWSLVVVVVVIVSTYVFLRIRRHAQAVRRDPAHVAYSRLCAHLSRHQLPRHSWEGPRDYLQRAAEKWPAHADSFQAVANHYIAIRYGADGADAGRSQVLRQAVKHAIANIHNHTTA